MLRLKSVDSWIDMIALQLYRFYFDLGGFGDIFELYLCFNLLTFSCSDQNESKAAAPTPAGVFMAKDLSYVTPIREQQIKVCLK